MYKLLIADDEPTIRLGLSSSIDWESIDVEIVGLAKNGAEAYEMAKEVYPDILITDIKMPIMDGLELCKKMEDTLPKVKKVLLTGYEEFEYAKKAISCNVKDYLLKPVGADKLLETVEALIQDIILETERENEVRSTKKMLSDNYFLLQSELLKKLVTYGNPNIKHILNELGKMDVVFDLPYFYIVIIEVDDYFRILSDKDYKQKEHFENNTRLCLQTTFNSKLKTIIGSLKNNQFLGIINASHSNLSQLKYKLKYVMDTLLTHYNLSVSLTVSDFVKDIEQLPIYFEIVKDQSINKIYYGKHSLIMPENYRVESQSTKFPYTNKDEDELASYITENNLLSFKSKIIELFERFRLQYTSKSEINQIIIRIVTISNHLLDFHGEHIETYLNRNIIYEISHQETLDDLKRWLIEYIRELVSIQGKHNYSKEISKAVFYIRNYYTTNITLDIVSKEVGLSPSYLSRLFKEETGLGFTDYVNTERINHAKKLLLSNHKSYEVATVVGFNDYKYFSRVFKRVTGLPPREWLKQNKTPKNAGR